MGAIDLYTTLPPHTTQRREGGRWRGQMQIKRERMEKRTEIRVFINVVSLPVLYTQCLKIDLAISRENSFNML